jgi:AraC family transcriptional regulator
MKAALRNYQARMERVLDHIDQHLDGDLDLETVSRVAAFSKFHFHRQFMATFGLSVHRYVQLARLKRASHRLAHEGRQSVTEIAMEAGYDAPDAFARAFRQRFGQSPSSFRKSPDWAPWLAAFGPLDNARSKLMQIIYTDDDVTIRDVPPTPVAIMEHRGDRATLGATIERFIAWRKAAGLSPETSSTYNISGPSGSPENPADYSMDSVSGPTSRSRRTTPR